MINNRQAGRRRGRGGNNGPRPNGGGGGGGQRDSGNRIDSRARGNANQLYEKYKNLAADSQRQGDRVTTEYYLQFADHYFRVLSESRARFDEQNQRRDRPDGFEAQPFTGSFDTGFDGQDDEFADEGEPIRPNEQRLGEQAFREDGAREGGEDAPRPMRNDRHNGANGQARREDRPRDDRPRDDRPRDLQPREDRPRRDEQAGERAPREFARDEGPRTQEPREGGEGRRPRRYRDEAATAPLDAPVQAAAPAEAPAQASTEDAEAPRRRGRPRRERPVEDAPQFDPAVLPPSLGTAPAAAEPAAEEEKPRRRRVRATPTPEASAAE